MLLASFFFSLCKTFLRVSQQFRHNKSAALSGQTPHCWVKMKDIPLKHSQTDFFFRWCQLVFFFMCWCHTYRLRTDIRLYAATWVTLFGAWLWSRRCTDEDKWQKGHRLLCAISSQQFRLTSLPSSEAQRSGDDPITLAFGDKTQHSPCFSLVHPHFMCRHLFPPESGATSWMCTM